MLRLEAWLGIKGLGHTLILPFTLPNGAAQVRRHGFAMGERMVDNRASTMKPTRLPVYVKRLQKAFRMQMSVPDGFWTVFDKSSNLLILVECDLKMPVDNFDLLDGSVGIRWGRFRTNQAWAGEKTSYTHIFPDRRGIQNASAYPLRELPFFEHWMKKTYIPVHLFDYLESKYGLSVSAKKRIRDVVLQVSGRITEDN